MVRKGGLIITKNGKNDEKLTLRATLKFSTI